MGIWPPSNAAEICLRALEPFVPRPAVLPFEPSPRPTRVRSVFAPGAGRRWCTLIGIASPVTSDSGRLTPRASFLGTRRRPACPEPRPAWEAPRSVDFLDLDEVGHGLDHSPDLRSILLDHHVVDPLEAERAQRLPLVVLRPDFRTYLGDLQACHCRHAPAAARAASIAA